MIPKFRVWDKLCKEMRDVVAIDFYHETYSWIFDDYVNIEQVLEEDDFENVVLMQSTGFMDKDGVEIYEGDIVNLHWFYFDGNGESEQELSAKEILNYDGMMCFEWQDTCIRLALIDWHEESFEIIGNIHENPELQEN